MKILYVFVTATKEYRCQENGTNEDKKQKRKAKDEVKDKLIRTLQEMDVSENEELDEQAEKVTKHKEGIPVLQNYENIIGTKKKDILNVALS